MYRVPVITTGSMRTQEGFRRLLKNDDIEFVSGSDSKDFVPQSGDIFVWSRPKNYIMQLQLLK